MFWNFMQSRHLWWPLWSLVNPDMAFVQAHVVPERHVCAYLLRKNIFVELENIGTCGLQSSGDFHSYLLIPVCITGSLRKLKHQFQGIPDHCCFSFWRNPSLHTHCNNHSFLPPLPPPMVLTSLHFSGVTPSNNSG